MALNIFTVGGACNCIAGLASPDDEYYGDGAFVANHPSPPVNADDLFTFGGSGLLTIGTLGFAAVNVPGEHEGDGDYDVDDEDCVDIDLDSIDGTIGEVDNGDVDDGDATPTFTFPQLEATAAEKVMVTVEAIAEKDDVATTEDDLMLVSAELEKVLGGSNVPSARVSFAMGVDCPLQGFLLGSPVCSDTESWPEKPNGGGRRASLGELFMRTRFMEEKGALVAVQESEDGGEREEGKAGKGGNGGHKRTKKWRVKDEKGADGDGVPASATAKSKFQKVRFLFLVFFSNSFANSQSIAILRSQSISEKCN